MPRRRVRRLHRGVMRAGRRTRSAAHSHHTLWKYPPSSTPTSTSCSGVTGSCSRSSCSSLSSTCRARVAAEGSRASRVSSTSPASSRTVRKMPRCPSSFRRRPAPSVAPCAMELTEPSRAWSPTSHRATTDMTAGGLGRHLARSPRHASGVASVRRPPLGDARQWVDRRGRDERGGWPGLAARGRAYRRSRAINRGHDGVERIARCSTSLVCLGRSSTRRRHVFDALRVTVDRARGSGSLARLTSGESTFA